MIPHLFFVHNFINQFELSQDNASHRKGAGFTLLEVLIYISVLAIVFLAVSSFLTWSLKTNTKASAIREAADNGRRAMEIMAYEIKGAKSVYGPTSSSTQLSLETKTSSFIDFYICGDAASAICLKKESQNPIAITSDAVKVSNLVFTQIATTTPSVQIQLKVDYKTEASFTATSTVSLRSY